MSDALRLLGPVRSLLGVEKCFLNGTNVCFYVFLSFEKMVLLNFG